MHTVNKLAIYVHIPFCKQKCKYCDFTSFENKEDKISIYVEALIKEILSYKEKTKNYIVTSVYFGGGTPSFIDTSFIEKIYNALKNSYKFLDDMEITIECNPGTVTLKKLKKYREIGINRISFGVQTFNDKLLKDIGRVHSVSDAISGFYMAREAGFNNISLDLMFGLPNQTIKDVNKTLNKFIELNPEHISTYSLKIEDKTVFGRLYDEGKLKLPDENEEREMYYLIKEKLKENGYEHYEISNFSKAGFESRHNTAYWERQNYLGFGLGASSCFEEIRFSNTSNFEEYIKNFSGFIKDREELKKEDIDSEKVILGLRMLKGIDEEFVCYDKWKKAVEKLINAGLVIKEEGKIKLTDKGLDLANQVFVEFI